ncbi:hypothetical protein J4H86_08915 [Spiractinospora alimapuensis]|uniref:zinc metallochaperone AztD n=1 Tax=Spiractinospora alimapuensis TaxID=2820884 RepID=UPI003743EABB|nr:hypothetical protein J4H86_08915 [Spiractinospora alimapuensis]
MNIPVPPRRPRPRAAILPSAVIAALALSACGADADTRAETDDGGEVEVNAPVVATYDGGILVLDGESLEVEADLPLDGFNRLNAAGDGRHVLVSTQAGFQVLDAVGAELTEDTFDAAEPGHVVPHAGATALFADGTGEVTLFDPTELGDGLPDAETLTTEHAHHGVAVLLEDDELALTLGDDQERTGVRVLDADREEVARTEECPGVHGEATAEGGVAAFGCEDGMVIYHDGDFTKVESPDDYGRIGNQAGHDDSGYLLGDYKVDPDAELERPERVAVVDAGSGDLELVDLGTSYSFRSLARGPHGEGLVLGTDGALHEIDLESGEITDSLPVVDAWEEPMEWQDPRPTIHVRDHTAYITDPDARTLTAVNTDTGAVEAETELPETPNELTSP